MPSEDVDPRIIDFRSGLGDVINRIFRSDNYVLLDQLERPIRIVLLTHNPYVKELFLWHPSRSKFVILEPNVDWSDVPKGGARARWIKAYAELGLDFNDRHEKRLRSSPEEIRFYPEPTESQFITNTVTGEYYIMQPFAGGKHRFLPPNIVDTLLQTLVQFDRKIFIIGRSYDRYGPNGKIHGRETTEKFFEHSLIVDLISQNLSVPATIELVKRCRCFIGTHSSMNLAAWYFRKNNVILYPKETRKHFVGAQAGGGYSFGMNYPNTYHATFENFSLANIWPLL